MENENLTTLTRGTIKIESFLGVPVLNYSILDKRTYTHVYQYKICRYVGTSCRVIVTCDNFDDAIDKLFYWRLWYKTNNIFLLEVSINVSKMSV